MEGGGVVVAPKTAGRKPSSPLWEYFVIPDDKIIYMINCLIYLEGGKNI